MQTENRVTWVFSVRRESCFSPGQVNSFILYAAMWLSSWFSLSLGASVAYLEASGCRTQTALSCCAIATEACRPSGTVRPPNELDEEWADTWTKICLTFHLLLHLTGNGPYSSWRCPVVVSDPWGSEVSLSGHLLSQMNLGQPYKGGWEAVWSRMSTHTPFLSNMLSHTLVHPGCLSSKRWWDK